jgi:hypothetical protein
MKTKKRRTSTTKPIEHIVNVILAFIAIGMIAFIIDIIKSI